MIPDGRLLLELGRRLGSVRNYAQSLEDLGIDTSTIWMRNAKSSEDLYRDRETLHPSVMDRMGLAQSDFCPDSKCNRLEQRKYAPKNLLEAIDRLKLSRTERRKDAQACGPWRLRPR